MKIKVLVISRNAWNNSSNNTLSNFFQDFEEDELAQIYCRDEIPDNKLCNRYFKISESQLLKYFFHKKEFAGEIVNISKINDDRNAIILEKKEKKLYDFFRNKRLVIFLWFRELIWLFGKWESPLLRKFISDFKPDIIYTEAFDTFYTYRLLDFVRSVTQVPVVLFHCDDQVTYRQFSLNPLYWVNRLILRTCVSRAIKQASINYCIIDEQKKVYEKIFKKEFKILNKCSGFNKIFIASQVKRPIKMVYAGNLFHGRWKTLAKLSDIIENINRNGIEIILEIYTANSLSSRIYHKLYRSGIVSINGYLPYEQIRTVQDNADILLHVESFNLREKLLTALSFSTKIVDYFDSGNCIMAIGWKNSAPLKYLKEKDAAIIVTDLNKLQSTIKHLINHSEIISEYGEKAYNCGKKYHNKSEVLVSFRNDLTRIMNT